MAITPKGIYFPTGEDAANWATIFYTMANSIDSALSDFTYDSGWIPITNFQNGWASYYRDTYRTCQRRKIGLQVFMTGLIRYGTRAVTAFSVPSGFIPSKNLYVAALTGSNGVTRLDLTSAGNVIHNGPQLASNGWLSISELNYYV